MRYQLLCMGLLKRKLRAADQRKDQAGAKFFVICDMEGG